MKKIISLFLSIVLLCAVSPQLIPETYATEAQSANFVNRSDGVWLWPTTFYAVSDWAGCNGAWACCFHAGDNHGGCLAPHETSNGWGHNGIDIPVRNAEVYAAASGTLYCTNYDWPSRGITAVVEHPINGTNWSYYSVYQHLQSTVTSKNGSAVAAGEVIAWSGNTNGYGGGDFHLHFSILMGASGQGNALAQAPNSNITAIENPGWITASGFTTGRILPNPALNSPAGTPTYTDGCESNVRMHAGSVMYTRNPSEVSIGEMPKECSHNYTSTSTPANCTQDGLREYACPSCGDTYSEPIEALGHNYIGVKTDATYNTAGYTTYTCNRCNDSYVETETGWYEQSSNNDLSGLTVNNAIISPTFNAATTNYTASVPFDVTQLNVTATTADSKATVSISNPNLIPNETINVKVMVTAENGAKKTYTIAVTRAQIPNPVASSNSNLSNINVSGFLLSPEFSADQTQYVIYLPYETEALTINGTPADNKASVTIEGCNDLIAGADNEIKVICTAEDGTQKVYTVIAKRAAAHDDNAEPIEPDNAEPEKPPIGTETDPIEAKTTSGIPWWTLLIVGIVCLAGGFAGGFFGKDFIKKK